MNIPHPLRRPIHLSVSAALLLTLAGCTPASAGDDRVQVVVTTSILGDLVSQLADADTEITVLIPAESDPHEYQPSTKDIQRLHTADLVYTVGEGFEETLEPQLAAATQDGSTIVSLGEVARLMSSAELYADEADHGDEHSHDEHSESAHESGDTNEEAEHDHHHAVDPHFWHDPTRVSDAVTRIAETLAPLSDNPDGVQERASAYQDELTQLDVELRDMFAALPESDRVLVTQHQVLGYLAERYEFRLLGSIIPSTSTLAQASAAQLHRLGAEVSNTGAQAVFTDVTHSAALAETLAGEVSQPELHVVPLYTESLSNSDEEASTYVDMMRTNAQRIQSALTR